MNTTPPAVRILPMDSREEFPDRSIEKLQLDFFLRDLPFRSDGYFYRKSGLQANSGTVVLFQFCGAIVASAVLRHIERFETPREEVYAGALHFDPRSVRVFDPVRENVIARIWPNVKRLSNVKWTLDPKRYGDFERELKHIEIAKP